MSCIVRVIDVSVYENLVESYCKEGYDPVQAHDRAMFDAQIMPCIEVDSYDR